jgi:hypothetical protein
MSKAQTFPQTSDPRRIGPVSHRRVRHPSAPGMTLDELAAENEEGPAPPRWGTRSRPKKGGKS